jgi:hypothetical protein
MGHYLGVAFRLDTFKKERLPNGARVQMLVRQAAHGMVLDSSLPARLVLQEDLGCCEVKFA